MPTFFVPDQDDPRWPKDILSISPQIEAWLDDSSSKGVLGILTSDWNHFGKGTKTNPPSSGSVPKVSVSQAESSMFQNYLQVASSLQQYFDQLQQADIAIVAPIIKSGEASTTGQSDIASLITTLSTSAAQPPSNGQNEDQWIISYMSSGLQTESSTMSTANSSQASAASSADSTTSDVTALENEIKALNSAIGTLNDKVNSLGNGGYGNSSGFSYGGTSTNAGASINYSSLFPSSGSYGGSYTSTGGYNTGGSYGSSYGSGLASELQNAIDSLQNSASGSSGTGSDLSSLMDSMMLPSMFNQMNGRNNNDSDLNNRRDQLNSNGEQSATPPPVSQSPASVQATQQPAAPAPSATPGTSSSQPTVTAPHQNSDGSVTYTFEDGRTQQVSVVVAQILDAARANKTGTDALAAYAKTPVKVPDVKHMGDPADPSQLITGDNGTWAADASSDPGGSSAPGGASGPGGASAPGTSSSSGASQGGGRTAIVVVFPPDQSNATGSLEVIVDGKLQPFTPQMSDSQGDFGQFAGFFHPQGVVAPASPTPTGVSAGPMAPVSTDPTGSAAPAVAAPTG
jgi:hypothetical protein